jgi:hypothetical protein
MKSKPRHNKAYSGLTIVELLVGIFAASVLAVTCSVIVELCFRTLRANREAVELQRDVDITTRTLYRAIRSSRRTQVTAPAAGATGWQLTIDSTSFYRADAGRTPSASGSFLVYDPNTTAVGNEQVLVDGTLQSCTFSNGTDAIGISFAVEARDDRIQVDTDIHMRNEI